jgi:hypothetical protein
MRMPSRCLWIVLLSALLPAGARARSLAPKDFEPDPRSVQRYGPAYRYPQAGWIVLHVEGEPYERGYQHGRLLAPEILGYVRCFAATQSPKAPSDGWKLTRALVDSLFLRGYDKEYLEEMKGIAAGASDAGARYDGRPLDLVDIAALNSWAEVETLFPALEATPTGLEGQRFAKPQLHPTPTPQPMHCSAFAATGPATADGKVVFGHITMFGLYPSNFFNVWLDLKPARGQGHRILMQSYPGGIQSGFDYYMNDGGLLVCETTLAQTRFNINGRALASRIRKVLQYADTIDEAAAILERDNNGLYTNEWLLADVKTNEIAMFELGTHKTKLYRSSKNEWFGGTEGFYWGCNNTKDLEVRLETAPGVDGRPANMVFHPSDRDKMWQRLYARYKGHIDAEFGKVAFTTPPIAAYHSLDAKFTTTDMAKELKTWALFGPPLGRSWQPTRQEQEKFPEIRPLASNPWTVLHAGAPVAGQPVAEAVDLKGLRASAERRESRPRNDERELRGEAVWRGTLLPKGDADTWLAAAFADYEHLVALERARQQEASGGRTGADDRDEVAVRRNAYRSAYLAAARAAGDVPLSKTRADVARDEWYRIADGKGVLLLHTLQQLMGDKAFADMMDAFGHQHAGKRVTAAEFVACADKTGKVPAGFFAAWLDGTDLPALRLGKTTVKPEAGKSGAYRVEGEVRRTGGGNHPAAAVVDVTVETAQGDVTKSVRLDGPAASFSIRTDAVPRRVVADKYGSAPRSNGGPYTVFSFEAEPEQALIVYGATDEAATNREAAEELQRSIVQRWSNVTVPVKSDHDVTEDDLKAHHLLLVGRPDCNAVAERVRAALPVRFGSRSFVVRGDAYAHADSAVIAAAANPLNPRYSVTVVAGLSAAATLRAAPYLHREEQAGAEVLVLPRGSRPRALVVPPAELVQELQGK